MPTVHVFDFLDSPAKHPPARVTVLFGNDIFLQKQAQFQLREQVFGKEKEPLFSTFDGSTCDWRTLHDELATVSLFGPQGRRLVVVEDADAFVTDHRDRLETYVEKPAAKSILVLNVGTWIKTTILYKLVDKAGLQVDCSAPIKPSSKNKDVDERRVHDWIVAWGKRKQEIEVRIKAAELLLELVGPNFGMLAQDLAKLALFVQPGEAITAELVQRVVGGWRAKTTWDLIDAATDGNAAEAILQLDRIFQSGSVALEVMGAVAWSLRRYAAATRIFEQTERTGRRPTLGAAIQGAGFKDWPPGTLQKAETRLIQLGRERAGKFYSWLVDIDAALKLSHSSPERSRLMVEQLVVRLSSQLSPKKTKR